MEKVIVITGASSGIGLELYKLYSKKGDIVVNLSRTQKEGLNTIICDVSKAENVSIAFKQIENLYGRIDLLINNAGYGLSGVTELVPLEAAAAQFETNFFGALSATQKALPLMKSGGKIIFISSACAIFPLPYRSLYCASKSALSMLSQSLRMELADAKIDVVSVCPGDTKTNFTKNREKHFDTNSKYEAKIVTATAKLDKRENMRMSANFVAMRIFKIANKKHTKPQYIVGTKYKIFHFSQKILPLSFFNKIIEKIFKK